MEYQLPSHATLTREFGAIGDATIYKVVTDIETAQLQGIYSRLCDDEHDTNWEKIWGETYGHGSEALMVMELCALAHEHDKIHGEHYRFVLKNLKEKLQCQNKGAPNEET